MLHHTQHKVTVEWNSEGEADSKKVEGGRKVKIQEQMSWTMRCKLKDLNMKKHGTE